MKKCNNDLFILRDKKNFMLSLRKKNLNKKLLEKRNNYTLNIDKERKNSKKANHKSENNKNNFINNIKYKFSEILSDKNKDEKNYLKCLMEIFEFIKDSFNDIEISNINEPLIESLTLEKIILNCIEKNQNNKKEILNILLPIFSCIIFIYNHLQNSQILKYNFISKKKYINFYLSLLSIKDDEIIYNVYKFLELLSHGSSKIMEQLYNENILEKIMENNFYDNEKEILEIKVCCISQFDMNIQYKENINLCLKIQNFYIFVYNNFIAKNNYNEELLKNFFKIISNLSYCISEEYIMNLLNSRIIHFLIEPHIKKIISKDNILKLIGNMNYISNNKLSLELYNISIGYIMKIILDKQSKEDIIGLALWCINNFADCEYLCLDIFFEKNILNIYRNYIITNQIIDSNLFYEICISFQSLIRHINEEKRKFIIKDYNIISLIIQGFKKIESKKNINKLSQRIVELIFSLLTIDDEELVNYCRFIFEKEGGNEYVFEKINLLLLEQNNTYNELQPHP